MMSLIMRYLIKLHSTKRSMVVAGARRRGKWELLFNGYKVSAKEDEKVAVICYKSLCLQGRILYKIC